MAVHLEEDRVADEELLSTEVWQKPLYDGRTKVAKKLGLHETPHDATAVEPSQVAHVLFGRARAADESATFVEH